MGCTSSIEQQTPQIKQRLTKSMSTFVCYRNISIKENVILLHQNKTQLDNQFLMQVLKKHYLFYQLKDESLQYLIKHMQYCLFKQNHNLYNNNGKSCIFIIDKGIIKTHNNITYQTGSIIGDDNLLIQNTKQIIAQQDTYLWALDKIQFNKAIEQIISQTYLCNRSFLQQQYIFQYLSQNQLDGIAANIIQAQYQPNQMMFSDEAFVIIKNGEASLFKGNQFTKTLQKRDSYGALYIINKPKNTRVRAKVETQCLILTQERLIQVLGFNIQKQIYQAIIRYVLNEIELPGQEIEKIIQNERYKLKIYNNEKIKQKQIHEDLSIIVDGYIDCEGERLLLAEYISDQFDNTEYIANGTIAVISNDCLYIEDYIIEENNDDEYKFYKPKQQELKHLQVIRRNVNNIINLVQCKYQQNYILRQIHKQPTQKTQQDRRIKQQRKILEILKCQQIPKFYTFYEDNSSYFLLFQFIDGTVLSEIKLNLQKIQSAILQIIHLLEQCYKYQIICRTIKLDNFLIDINGNISLINLLNAKQAQRTYTIIGSPHYMAPEILEGRGYDCNSDVWSLGICMFELLFESVPFGQALDDPYQIYEEIISCQTIEFPDNYNDQEGKRLLRQLLNKNIYQRIGSNFDQLKNHNWFKEQESILQELRC